MFYKFRKLVKKIVVSTCFASKWVGVGNIRDRAIIGMNTVKLFFK